MESGCKPLRQALGQRARRLLAERAALLEMRQIGAFQTPAFIFKARRTLSGKGKVPLQLGEIATQFGANLRKSASERTGAPSGG